MKKLTLAIGASILASAATVVYAASPAARDHDKTMTRAEVTAMAGEMFTRMDANSDGVINQADRDAMRNSMFDRMDANKDGSISREEFTAAHPGRGGPGMAAHGSPRMEGHHGRHGGMGGRHGGMGKMMLRMADADKDGSVTRAEFDTAVAAHFDRVDANRDGSITKEERKAAHDAMKAEMRGHAPGAH